MRNPISRLRSKVHYLLHHRKHQHVAVLWKNNKVLICETSQGHAYIEMKTYSKSADTERLMQTRAWTAL